MRLFHQVNVAFSEYSCGKSRVVNPENLVVSEIYATFAIQMPNSYFRFRQFVVCQDRCAMKVGTDGTLLGAWARGGERILDIGGGTGLIALMMAQRYAEAEVVTVELDVEAALQARENVAASPFASRIRVVEADVRKIDFTSCRPFDAIVSNPPYFRHSLKNPDAQRSMARHADSLSYDDLFSVAEKVLAPEGEISVVIPFDCVKEMEEAAYLRGFFSIRKVAVKTTHKKQPRRYLLSFGKSAPSGIEREEHVLETAPGERSDWYRQLTEKFYL